ncbi:DMT family transporter [Motilimonas sp. KMU-193]|uniref:DMT family transporter n=1 Tax=Motilimonas sp. KMU-193 TaxID=3388668 RepID=UPI00396B0646
MLFALAAVAMWSTVATAFKVTLAYFSPIQMILVASLTSIVLLAGICWQQKKLPQVVSLLKQQGRLMLLLGLINPLCYYLLLFQAYDLLPAQQAQALNYTWAISLTLLAVPLLGQKLTKADGLAILLGYGGVLVIATQGDLLALNFNNPLGVALALASTLLWALYWILNTRQHGDPIVALLCCFLLSLPFIIAVNCYLGEFDFSAWQGWAGAIYIGVFEMGLAFVCWLNAMKYAEHTASISNLIFVSPFASLFLLNWIIGEPIYASTLVGLGLIITALLTQQWLNRKLQG